MSASPARHRVALAVALAGVALSALTFFVHRRIAADASYTSFCNLGGAINCDIVLGSRYGSLLGAPAAAGDQPGRGLRTRSRVLPLVPRAAGPAARPAHRR